MPFMLNKIQKLFVLFGFMLATTIQADSSLSISNGWVPEAPPVAPVMAAYLTINNNTNKVVSINTVKSPGFKIVEIHKMVMQDNMMRMTKLPTLTIPAKSSVSLEPGGLHLMLINPLRAFKASDKIKLTFNLSDNETLTVQLPVQKQDRESHKHQHQHQH